MNDDDYPESVPPLTSMPSVEYDWAPSEVQPDILTSEIPPRLAEDGLFIREYSPVLHDKPVKETPAIGSDGRRFGTSLTAEPLSMSLDNARVYLAAFYGFDKAESMLMQALSTGRIINGDKFKTVDSQSKITGKMAVTTDKSRNGEFVLIINLLKQSGGRRK